MKTPNKTKQTFIRTILCVVCAVLVMIRCTDFDFDQKYGGSRIIAAGGPYGTVTIGGIKWMDRNLNAEMSHGSWCYDNSASNCDKYGRLYTWEAANSACAGLSGGWRLPSNAEWDALTAAVGGSASAGRHLKAQSGWYDCGPSGSDSSYRCDDTYGFSALPGGIRWSDGSFIDAGGYGYWWTATEIDATSAYNRYMSYNIEYVFSLWNFKSFGFSARCVRD